MKRSTLTAAVLLLAGAAISQQLKFNRVIEHAEVNLGGIQGITQDGLGYIWIGSGLGAVSGTGGLHRYDGAKIVSYRHDPQNPNSISGNLIQCVLADSLNAIWAGTYGFGLERLDLSTNTFTHFRHNPNDSSSLINDTVFAIMQDRLGNIWVGTGGGLDFLNRKTGKFTHYRHIPKDSSSLSSNRILLLYEDRRGDVWIGCFDPSPEGAGLNKFDRTTGNFIRYRHEPGNPNSIASNVVRAIHEDSRGNFWVGTSGDGLHTMDRDNGSFTHYYNDPKHPEKIGLPFVHKDPSDGITFITEDAAGGIWIGSARNGLYRYDPANQKATQYGNIVLNRVIQSEDLISGFNDHLAFRAFTSKDKQLWIATLNGNLFNINLFKSTIPFYSINGMDANTFYHDPKNNVLWMGTDDGLVRKDLNSGSLKILRHDSLNANSLAGNNVVALRVDKEGKFWIATTDGLNKYDPNTNTFTTLRHKEGDANSFSRNFLNNLCIDYNNNVWAATAAGISMMDVITGKFTNYSHNSKDTNSLSNNNVRCIAAGKNNEVWAGTLNGINRLNTTTGKFTRYLPSLGILSVYIDSNGEVWAGVQNDNLYRYDKNNDRFIIFTGPNPQASILGVLHILEDEKQNLWIHTPSSIVKIHANRNIVTVYGADYGVHKSNFLSDDNFISNNGQIFIGDEDGYYAFFPDQLKDISQPPVVNIIDFKLGEKTVTPIQGGILESPIWQTDNIKLSHNQNSFSFDFGAVNFTSPGALRYHVMLENYDNSWHNTESEHKAYFYNIPPGKYIFHAKATNSDGTWGEKTITIVITPPWWRTWWAYCLYGLLIIAGILVIHRLMKQRVIAVERDRTRAKELAQAKEIEKAYHELKATQQQLIQSEKMASLGELTAGIAHEIQNPLNFVNNFSDVSNELLEEMKTELAKGNSEGALAIAGDVKQNLEKILHHGKRADGIVKGMLQHSRSSSGVKELVDINALADEYLRLSYHGLRAKDKSFNAKFEANLDSSVEKINVVPQEIGRVILNLINNAFYAVTERKKLNQDGYEPAVSVRTRKENSKIEIRVKDNGTGIPQKVLDKIFQPFFTTKPTGEGTGLGLSLAYDIIKSHGGEIQVNTKEDEGSEFIVQLPNNVNQ